MTLPPGAYAVYGTMNLVDAPTIEIDDNDVGVRVKNGRIIVDGEYESVEVYNLSGYRVDTDCALPSGVYIVNVDGYACKVAVR